jgi:hypothetical protein
MICRNNARSEYALAPRLLAAIWGATVARRLLDECMRLEELPDLSRLAERFDL